ncbi:MAG: hypothetical protein JST84_04895 [Acidobacteria bacterium]|nr:hypothetical protein [Acidobacteriota bacterium]
MKTKFKPSTVVIASVLVTATLISVSSWLISRYERGVDVSVDYVNSPARNVGAVKPAMQKINAMEPDGEVFHTAKQVREASAILLAATLSNVQRRLGGRVPENVAEAANGVPVPGELVMRSAGIWESNEAIYYLRYRVTPIGFEVAVQPKNPGPKLLLRLDSRAGLECWQATKTGEVEVPAPFATLATFVGKGWAGQPLKTEEMNTQEKAALIAWAQLAAKE